MTAFRDRRDAGQKLAQRLIAYEGDPSVVVLGLARGGVPIAYEIARRLRVPLDVLVVRKLGVPGHPEFAMGAIASGELEVIDAEVVRSLHVSTAELEETRARERAELARREKTFRAGRPPADVTGRTVILVDDGLATGSSMKVAITALRTRHPERIIAAVPIAPPETCLAMHELADDVICLITPKHMYAVGLWYEDFAQTGDDEVHALLAAIARGPSDMAHVHVAGR
jgi:putative phosphoribosyl transferase